MGQLGHLLYHYETLYKQIKKACKPEAILTEYYEGLSDGKIWWDEVELCLESFYKGCGVEKVDSTKMVYYSAYKEIKKAR